MSKASFRVCFCCRRIFKLRLVEPPEDIKKWFNQYSGNGTMSIDDLHRFLIEVQGETNATKDDALAIFDSLKHLNMFQRSGFHLETFFRYLRGDLNSPLPPPRVHHNMNAPLAHYFLYTGHNSYLTGNQVTSSSSIEPIINALWRGVRVIELDLWPNAAGENVEVRHGGTLTSPVDLHKCLHAIKDNAFLASEYPVVITFEDHLSSNLQAKVAKMVSKIFGGMLYCPTSESLPEFPSPESLKRRVMISTKPPKEYLESENSKQAQVRAELETTKQVDGGEHLPDEDEDTVSPEYRHLIAIHAGKLKGGLQNWLKDDPNKVRRLSLSEQELENATKTHGTAIVRFTQRNLLRIYPKGTRVDSSNYNPLVGWMHGAQMVAFNMQGHGKFLWQMQGMFRANGGCGYIKKPDFLLPPKNQVFDPSGVPNNQVFDPSKKYKVQTTLKVNVYLGEGWDLDFSRTHFDRFSPPDFFTRVGIAGVPADSVMKKTKVTEDQWFPVWNQEFHFRLTVPELALLRVEVAEFDTSRQHDFGGQTCLPLSELRTGIRAVRLHDRKGEMYRSVRLLMYFEFDPPYEFQIS